MLDGVDFADDSHDAIARQILTNLSAGTTIQIRRDQP
jgi:hypothetical protein